MDWGDEAELWSENGHSRDPDGHEMLEVKAAPKKFGNWLHLDDEKIPEVPL